MQDAGVLEQVARMLRPSMRTEVSGRRANGEALHARTDRHRDHVLLEALVVADAGIEACRQHVDEVSSVATSSVMPGCALRKA